MKKFLMVFLMMSLLFAVGCQAQEMDTETPPAIEEEETVEEVVTPEAGGPHPTVTMTMDDGNVIVMEMLPEMAPNSVNNFLTLATEGFYDDLIFHRVIEGFMIQGGDPEGTGGGGPGYSIAGEFSDNGVDNTLSHEPGVVSMARSRDYDSAGSQFFIVHGDATFLDGQYAAFGQVIEGFDYVDAYAQVKTASGDRPEEPLIIKSMTVDLNGYDLKAPIKVQ